MRISMIKKLGLLVLKHLNFLFKENGMPGHLVYKKVTDFVTSFLSE